MKYGLFAGIAGIGYFIILTLIGQSTNQALSYVGFLILGAFIFVGQKAYKDEGDGYMNFGQGVGIGTLISLISGTISAIFMAIYVNVINTGYMDMIMDKSMEDMEARGMDNATIEQSMEFMEGFMLPMMLIGSILGSLIIGLIISLILSAINKNPRPENEIV